MVQEVSLEGRPWRHSEGRQLYRLCAATPLVDYSWLLPCTTLSITHVEDWLAAWSEKFRDWFPIQDGIGAHSYYANVLAVLGVMTPPIQRSLDNTFKRSFREEPEQLSQHDSQSTTSPRVSWHRNHPMGPTQTCPGSH